MGRFGNVLLTAGKPDSSFGAQLGEVVRFYFTNTANTRVFNIGLKGARMKLVGGDSGRCEQEQFVAVMDLGIPNGIDVVAYTCPMHPYAISGFRHDGRRTPSLLLRQHRVPSARILVQMKPHRMRFWGYANARGGHSSLPPRHTAVGILSAAITRLEENPMPARLEASTRHLFDLGPQFPLPLRLAFANLWLTRPLVVRRLEGNPATNAMVRTTTAPTMFHAGTKGNVLPTQARAAVNFRILPGDSVASVIDHVGRVVDDTRVQFRTIGRFSAEPSAVSSIHSESFRTLERTIQSVNPDAVVAPYLVSS
jgi:hypothetical protein